MKNRTLANLSSWASEQIEALRAALRGDTLRRTDEPTILRSLPHGHVAAVLGMARKIGLDRLLPEGLNANATSLWR
ncbi:MAG: hypothetical protein J2P54_16960 [Bradyrhizobiaceae bacterium]|nr:hypothetical protein [Bradyrhizobiaceae bacterium]MBO0757542.1 hypothetical protein [Bradyrhizobiaceae bacterium]